MVVTPWLSLGRTDLNTGVFGEKHASLGSHHSCLAEGDSVDPNKKMMVEGLVAAFAKAAPSIRCARRSDHEQHARAQLCVFGG